ncbi:calvin cycle protein CP12-3, chloroplastic-like [Oryza brachyantha]|uniref:CP12 domain-containing protein n=1 Tax=Oryza brachyantha TaxID=4533 RepID=J3MUD4_ORYBR|nr:calvin cycle protein CP12-3, chloroplastic-like [Oryza brachyantha]
MASPPLTSLFSAAAPPAGAFGAPAYARLCPHRQRRRRPVAASVKWRYKGTARKEAVLSELIERKVAEATEACAGEGAAGEAGCRVAWDEVEEVSQARADLRRRIAEGADDPLEPFCSHNPLADDCAVVYGDE